MPLRYVAGCLNNIRCKRQDQQQQQILNQPQFPPQIVGKYSQQLGLQDQQGVIGHGAQYLYLHQQLLARYELNRLSNGLGPIRNLDFKNVQALYQPHLRNLNGLELPSRPENLPLQPQNVKLIQRIYTLQQRLLEAIDSGLTVNPQGVFLPLYQSQGVNILGDLIEGCGRSINPRSVALITSTIYILTYMLYIADTDLLF